MFTDLHNRGLKDILIACIDNLKGFREAIESIYTKTEVQSCMVHQIRKLPNEGSQQGSERIYEGTKAGVPRRHQRVR